MFSSKSCLLASKASHDLLEQISSLFSRHKHRLQMNENRVSLVDAMRLTTNMEAVYILSKHRCCLRDFLY